MKFNPLFLVAPLLLTLCGCGGSNTSSSSVSISVSPTTATVIIGQTKQFTAKVQGSTRSDVLWYVNGVNGGDATHGTISGDGLYSAPPDVGATTTITITAIAAADTSKTADASVTVARPIEISPNSLSVQAGETQQFVATVHFSSNTGVAWQVNGIAGGNSSIGTISSAGLYTAPSSVPSPNPVTVTAVAKADTTQTASSDVTITPPAIVLSPLDVTMAASAKQTFSATVVSSIVHPTWTLTCNYVSSVACGNIDSAGVYTAPVTPPRGAKVTVTASMPDGSATSASTTATIQFSNATLSGSYAFKLSGPSGTAAQAGILTFDGAGHLSGGILDSTDTPGVPLTVSGGTYQVSADGRGTMTIQGSFTSFNLDFALSNNARGFIVRTDSAATGTIDLQQSTASISQGSYVASFGGQVTEGATADLRAAGSITFASNGKVGSGILDSTRDAVLQTQSVTSGSYTDLSGTGRGTLTLSTSDATQVFAYYPVDQSHFNLIAIDGSSKATGELFAQSASPYSASSFKGAYTYSLGGTGNNVPFGMAGVFTLSGTGSITDIQFSGLTQSVFDFNPGAYSVTDPSTGRTSATWTANSGSKLQYVFYPRQDGSLVLLETDGAYAASGIAKPQGVITQYNFLTLKGAFALEFSGENSSTGAPTAFTGAVIPYASVTTSTMSGTVDGVAVGQGTTFVLNLTNLNLATQRYEFGLESSDTLGTGPASLYRISDDDAFVLISDGIRVLLGTLSRQY